MFSPTQPHPPHQTQSQPTHAHTKHHLNPPIHHTHPTTPQEHGECVTIRTRFRPVPLRWMFCYAASGPRAPGSMTDLLDSTGRSLNPRLSMERFIKAEAK